ncbi:MAG: DUF4347 domain-containing protein, partial [Magnetococcales bacterium]|nr:DUF4347 domain-containing protein [Magnetococcales bacterium]
MKLWSWIRDHLFGSSKPEGQPARPPTLAPSREWRSRLALRLEKRLMFDAAGVLTALAALHHDSHADGSDHDTGHDADHSPFPPPAPDSAHASPKEMIFIDSTVPNYQALISDVPPNTQVVVLDPNRDGVEQIRATLAGHSGIQAIHIVSHGSSGYLALGNSELDVVNLEDHAHALQEWGTALTENADILIYGCDVGAGMTGGAFVSRMADLTGADVAASNNLTGATDRGGDWILEVNKGVIDTPVFVSDTARLEFHGILPSSNPVIANLHGDTLAYSEGSGSLVIDQGGNVTVTDPDSADFNGGAMTVAITANRDSTEDVLAIRNQGTGAGQIGVSGANVTYQGTVIGTFAGGSGTNDLVIAFNANANPTAVTALVRNITYTNTDTNNPTVSSRSISFSMTDGDGGASATVTASAAVTGVNDAPTLAGASTINYTENALATAIHPSITLADVDNTTLQSAVVSISANYQNGSDQLLFTNTASITGSWNAATGTLTLTGADTLANYQAALRSVKFQNISDAPTTTNRTIAFQVNDGSANSAVKNATVTMTAVNDAPTINSGGPTLAYTENDPASVVDATITLADADNANLQSAVISISGNYQSGADQLLFTNTASITGAWNAATGTLTLTGADTVANYQAALRSVKYQNTSDAPTTTARTVSFQVNDGTTNSTASTAAVNITAVNDAPTLSGTQWFPPAILRTDATNTGTTVGSLFAAADITDPDPVPLEGVAIYAQSNAGIGQWEYRVDGGAWNTFPPPLNTNHALLLKSTDEIRFVPDNSNGGQPTLSFYAWDRTSGTAGTTVNATTRGGITAFSSGAGTIKGTVNAAPVLDISGSPALPTITEDQLTNTGQTVSALLGASITDADTGAIQGIAIQTTTTDNGAWQYSTNGGASWNNIGVVSSAQSLLLRSTDRVRFLPDGMNPPFDTSPGSLNFTYVAWDRTGQSSTWSAGSKVSTATRGNATPFSVNVETASITVTDLNDAPVLTPFSPTLPAIMHTETTNTGVTVASMVGGSISDVDVVTAPLQGIAIHTVANGTSGGFWEYSTDNGASWSATGAVSSLQALLLRPQDKIRYQPGALNTTDAASIGYFAWDQTQNLGQQGTKTDVSTRGGTTAFSTTGDTATIRINVAPTLDASASPALPTITEDDTTNSGATVSTLLGGAGDIDVGAARGIALYGLNSGNGTWQYNTGSGWTNVGAVSSASALLLRESDQIRFIPNAIKGTTPDISFYAWDQTTGSAGTKVDVSSRGATTAFSVTGDTATIGVTEVNDAPTISVTATTLTFTEGSAPVAINNTLTLTDVDDLNLAGATVRITGNLTSSEDVLAFTNQSGITGFWDGATGTLTLTGSATKAQYQTALRSITYQNTNTDNPATATRTVTFTITDRNSDSSGFGALTASGARPVAISAVNDAPTLSASGTTLSYTEGDAPTVVDSGLTLSDVDDTQMNSATIQITGNYRSGEDVLAFTNQAGITGVWSSALGKLTLTGTATRSDYQTALRSVTYQNLNSDTPDPTTRTITFSVTDANSGGAGGGALIAAATRSIAPIAVNDAPTASASASILTYTEGDGAVIVDNGLSLADVDDPNIAGATIQIISNHHGDQDQLAFVNRPGITGSWNAATGTLTLSGTATKVDYQAALRSITYQNNNTDNPATGTRSIRFTITDANSNGQGSGALTVSVQRDIALTPINDAPGVATTAVPLSYTESNAATPVDPSLSLSDVDDATVTGATIQITGHYLASEDLLAFADQSGITGSWNAATGKLTLTGTASKADYETALRSVTYVNSNNANPSVSMRTVTFSVTDGNSEGTGAGAITTSASRNIVMTVINDAPNMTTDSPLSYNEGEAAKAVDTGLSLSDVDDDNIVGGMVQITGNYRAGEDYLAFTNQSGITGTWNGATGALVLTGSATKADYEAALRTVSYHNSNSDSPSSLTRTVTFSVTDGNSNGFGDGSITTRANRALVVTPINDAPGVSTSAIPLAYTESGTATPVDASITLADVDDASIAGATVQITGHYLSSEDVLSFTDQSGISGSWNAATGTLTLSGTASKADYEAALRSVTYVNSNNDNPSVALRTVTFSVTDTNSNGEGAGALTTTASRDIVLTTINDAPGVSTSAIPLAYTESGTATPVDAS